LEALSVENLNGAVTRRHMTMTNENEKARVVGVLEKPVDNSYHEHPATLHFQKENN
jgi:hypothetical protein